MLSSNIIQIKGVVPSEVCKEIANRIRTRRLELNLTQAGLANRSGVNIETYRKFERSGEISFCNLVKIAIVFGVVDDFNDLFVRPQYQNLDELLDENRQSRKRGKKK